MGEKKKVLLTGSSGFIGRNIKGYLSTICDLETPARKELNLLDEEQVREYLKENRFDVVIHSANPNPVKNSLDKQSDMFEDSIRVFMNLYQAEEYYGRMYSFGSGAEYDKSGDIVLIREEEAGRSVPYDTYGLIKYTISRIIEKSEKQYNLRIFGCYGPTDHGSKFITHAIRCCMSGSPITIRQDCMFDYMHVSDLAKIMEYFIYHKPEHRVYNVCTATRHSLSEIAAIVREQMGTDNEITLLSPGWNKEYTGDNRRLLSEIGGYSFLSLEEGIKLQIESEKRNDQEGLL